MRSYYLLYLVTTLLFFNCGGKKNVIVKKPTQPVQVTTSPVALPSVYEDLHIKRLAKNNPNLNKYTLSYIKKYAPIAVKEMHAHQIPASITLAQGILESGRGRSLLASKSNNHFGIKCHTGWTGDRVYHDDDEKGECFRKYLYPETSYKDHSKFLTGRRRYAFLFTYKRDDYKKWAYGLKKAGYATDKKYPLKLIKLINDYELYAFDNIKESDYDKKIRSLNSEEKINDEKTKKIIYVVKKGDTLYSISRKYGVEVDVIRNLNNLTDNSIAIGQKLVVRR